MFSKNAFGILLLLIVAIGSWYLVRTLQSGDTEQVASEMMQSGFYVRSARVFGTGADGAPLYRIEAEYAEQQENEDVEFQNVEIHYASEVNVPWILNADKALIGDDREFVTLSGHVVAISSEGFSGDVTEIRTDYLELEPNSFRAETDNRVQIRIGARSLTATGMLAMLQTNQVKLKSNVSGKFAP